MYRRRHNTFVEYIHYIITLWIYVYKNSLIRRYNTFIDLHTIYIDQLCNIYIYIL